jgi:hypothetical protein
MPKPVLNNKIIYQNIYGLLATHTNYLNQGVTIQDSPTFANLVLTGDATVQGNLYVEGNTTILDTNLVEFEDNIFLINRLETGAGVTLNQSGFEIERGSLENYRVVFNESDKTLRIGVISNLEAVPTREDNPLGNGVVMWNNTLKRMDSRNVFSIDMSSSSTTNSTSSTSGSFVFSGGIGVQKDIWNSGRLYLTGSSASNSIFTNSTTNSLHFSSGNDISFYPINNVTIPYNKNFTFGESTQFINADSVTKDITIGGSGHIRIDLDAGKRIDVPNQIPVTFSTPNDKIYTDSSNNMNIAGSEDIILTPGASKRVLIPDSLGLSFSNYNQKISANLNNDLTIQAGNDINLTPTALANVNIPTDNGIKFGNSGLQKIYANSTNDLHISASDDIYLTPAKYINIPVNKRVNFGTTEYIISSTGNLVLSASDNLHLINGNVVIDSTDNIDTSISSGSVYTMGGIGAEGGIYTKNRLRVESDNTDSLIVVNSVRNVLKVDSDNTGHVNIFAGDGTVVRPTLEIRAVSNNSAKSLISLQTAYDTTPGYMIGRGDVTLHSSRVLSLNIPSYNDYGNSGDKPVLSINSTTTELFTIDSDGFATFTNTTQTTNASTASLVLHGGIGIAKDIQSTGKIVSTVNSDNALLVQDTSEDIVFNIDSNNKIATLNGKMSINNTGVILQLNETSFVADESTNRITSNMKIHITDTTDTNDTSTASFVVSGGASIQKMLRVSGQAHLYNSLHMHDQLVTNIKDPVNLQDAATKAYVDLASLRGLYVKQSVDIATITNGNLATDFNPGSVIDGYTLQEYTRILIKNQTNQVENGIYIVHNTGPPQRSLDLPIGEHAAGVFTFIRYGSVQASTGWICNSDQNNDVIGTHNIIFAQFSGLGAITAGPGLTKNFNEIYVNVDNYSIEIDNDILRIKDTTLGTGLTGGSGQIIQTTSDQSHVTKLGTVDTGTWRASTVQVTYGGTGKTFFSKGNILFGNDTDGLLHTRTFFYDNVNERLGLGTDTPSTNLEISSISSCTLLLSSDSASTNPTDKPQVQFKYGNDHKSSIGMSRILDDYSNNIYGDALVISHNKTDSTSVIQLATANQSRMTLLHNGNVGIATSTPSATLDVAGSLQSSGLVTFTNTTNSTNVSNGSVNIIGGVGVQRSVNIGGNLTVHNTQQSTSDNSGAVVIKGGLSITCNENANNVGNGGALTVGGGASFGGDLYVGGSINGSGSSSSTYAYLTLTATDEAVNYSTGSLVSYGGITLQCHTNSSSLTDGGSILTEGGASINMDLYIGGDNYFYGLTNYYNTDNCLLNFYKSDETKCFSIDINSGNFSVSRYISGTFAENTFNINQQTGSIVFYNSSSSVNSSTASFIITGGLSVRNSTNATSVTNGGGLTLAGGASIGQDFFIGGDIKCSSTTPSTNVSTGAFVVSGGVGVGGSLSVQDKIEFSEGGSFDIIKNTSGSLLWNYFGIVNDIASSSSQIEFHTKTYGVKIKIDISGTTCNANYNSYGSDPNFTVYIYKDASDKFHLFSKTNPNTTVHIFIMHKTGNRFSIANEGNLSEPDGSNSGYQNSWTLSFDSSASSSNLDYNFGSVYANGPDFKITDNFPIVGKNTETTGSSRNIGLAFQRYQSSNDSGLGELANDPYVFFDSLPNQSTSNSTQVKFSNLANSTDDYYIGWWIKIASGPNVGQVRKIVSYNGSQRVAEIDTQWTSQNPSIGDIVYFYNAQYVSFYYDYSYRNFKLVSNTLNQNTKDITSYDYVGLDTKTVTLYDTTPCTNASTGALVSFGGISISNTSDAVNCSNGGTFTTLGGGSVGKNLYVGEQISIGQSDWTPRGSLHIKQTDSIVVLENTAGANSYIDFTTTGINNRFGILSKDDTLSLTYSTANQTPENSNRSLTITSSGYIGINTTSNISSPVTLLSNNLISSDSKTGYIGLVSSNTNNISTTDPKVILYGDNTTGSGGHTIVSSGTGGSITIMNGHIPALVVNNLGRVTVHSTAVANNSTSGSFVLSGGMGICSTTNSSNVSNGGALTIGGGASILKDTYIGGDLHVSGQIYSEGSVLSPTLTFSNEVACTLAGYENSKLIIISHEAILSFCFWVTASVASENCSIEFSIPERITNFTNRRDLIISCSGYTDDDNVIPLFNVIGAAVKSSTRGFIKFQSVSTGIHYFTVTCRYSTL